MASPTSGGSGSGSSSGGGQYSQLQEADGGGEAEPPPLAHREPQQSHRTASNSSNARYTRVQYQHLSVNQPSPLDVITSSSGGGGSIQVRRSASPPSPTSSTSSALSSPLVAHVEDPCSSPSPTHAANGDSLKKQFSAISNDDLTERPHRERDEECALTDPSAAASDETEEEEPVAHPVHSSLLYIASLGLLICWIANNILWIYVSDYFGVAGAFYQNQSTAVIYLVLCLPVVGWRWSQGRLSRASISRLPWRVCFIMGLCDAIYNLLTSLASPRMSGPMQNLIFQLPVPLAMIILKLLWPRQERSTFYRGEYAGATIIVVGAIVSILPQLLQAPDADSTPTPSAPSSSSDDDSVPVPDNNVVSTLIYIVGVVSYTVGSVYKEDALKTHDYIDCAYVSLVENFYALILGFLLVPMLWIPGVGEDRPSNTWTHFKGGAHCMFRREAPPDNPRAQCADILWICCVWIVSNIGVNVLGLVVVRAGDSVYYNLSSSVQLPITNLLFTSSFIMTSALVTTMNWSMWLGLAIVCVGVVLYHFFPLEPTRKGKAKAKAEAKANRQQQQKEKENGGDEEHASSSTHQSNHPALSLQATDQSRPAGSISVDAAAFNISSSSPSPSPTPSPPPPSSSSSSSSPLSHTRVQLRSIASASSSASSAMVSRASPEQQDIPA